MNREEVQELLAVAEQARAIVFWDLETTGTGADYDSVLVGCVKPYRRPVEIFQVKRPGDDRELAEALAERLGQAYIWVTFYGRRFDVPFLESRLLHHGLPPLRHRPHLDLYYLVRHRLALSRRSQAHVLRWLEAPEQKMTLSPDTWNEVVRDPERGLRTLVRRCVSDVRGLEALYLRLRRWVATLRP
ncbi:MAG: ribonuclease H-like domain-containing protein [Armatimonadota bacterium]|nr:ribonuclease H-like domain-containing protein [Armatimonadota bacterium]MDR7559473.1 ribonuclease H-like domain-containing protein [Armatimonadota bacterium]